VETARALCFYALGIPFFCAIHLITRACYAVGDTRSPVRLATRLVLLNLGLNLALVFPMGVAGLALSTSFTAGVNAVLLARVLRRHHGVPILASWREAPWLTLALALAAGGAAALLEPVFGAAAGPIAGLALSIALAAALFLGLASLLGMPEARALGAFLRRR
jgi:putative peptidoglycan lipid II flippase